MNAGPSESTTLCGALACIQAVANDQLDDSLCYTLSVIASTYIFRQYTTNTVRESEREGTIIGSLLYIYLDRNSNQYT